MENNVSFTLTIEFSDEINDNVTLKEIASNLVRGIINEINNGMGIVPEYEDEYTKKVSIIKNGKTLAETTVIYRN